MAAGSTDFSVPLAALLADFDTIASEASSGIASRHEYRLEPGETRPAAILFLDLVGYTYLSRQLDTESLSCLVDRVFRIFDLSVRAEGGYCDKVIGDAGLYVFAGHPNFAPACEAVLSSALLIRERIRRINASLTQSSMSIVVRAGVSFGLVTRKRIGGETQQVTVIGEAVNLAQRLEVTAEPGMIQTVDAVLAEVGAKFITKPRGELELKGFGKQAVYSVEARRSGPRLRCSTSHLTPLIGRKSIIKHSCATVKQWWQEAPSVSHRSADSAHLLLLHGPIAVGKSRLAWEISRRLTGKKRAPSCACTTVHFTERTTLLEFAAEFCTIAGLKRENLQQRWDALTGLARQAWSKERLSQLAGNLPFLAYILECDAIDTRGISQADSASFNLSCRLALKACLELAALECSGRALIIAEDMQWLGGLGTVLGWLLANSATALPLVLICTARPGFNVSAFSLRQQVGLPVGVIEAAAQASASSMTYSSHPISGIPAQEHDCVLEIEPLTPDEADQLLATLLPGLELPQSVRAELHEKGQGVPYYYEEIVRMLLAQGAITKVEGRYCATREIAGLDMPADIRMLLLGRLDLLRPELRELACHASVLGGNFRVELLARLEACISGEDPGSLSAAVKSSIGAGLKAQTSEISALVDELVQERILTRDSNGRIFFDHRLTLEAAYSSLLHGNRIQLHRAAAVVIEAEIVPGTAAELQLLPVLAQHRLAAGQCEESVRTILNLLLVLGACGFHKEWDAWFGKLEELGKSAVTQGATDIELFPMYHFVLAQRALNAGEIAQAQAFASRAHDLSVRAGDLKAVARAQNELGTIALAAGQMEAAQRYYQLALEPATAISDDRLISAITSNLGLMAHCAGRKAAAQKFYEDSILSSKKLEDRRGYCMTLSNLAALHFEAGEYALALTAYRDAYAAACETSNLTMQACLMSDTATVYIEQEEFDQAGAMFDAAHQMFEVVDDRSGLAYLLANRGVLLLRQKAFAKAERDFLTAVTALKELDPEWRQFALAHAALCRLEQHNAAGASELFLECDTDQSVVLNRRYTGLLTAAVLGLVAARLGHRERAGSYLHLAEELYQPEYPGAQLVMPYLNEVRAVITSGAKAID